jgi:hypothetical protein
MGMNNLAETYRQQGWMTEAAELQVQVLEQRKRILGENHPDTLITMNNLIEIYQQEGRIKEVAELQKRVAQADNGTGRNKED